MDSPTVLRTAAMLGLSSSIWLSGIYFGSSHLTLPILYRFPAATSSDIFVDFYYRGIPTVIPLCVTATLSSGLAAYIDTKKRVGYAVAGALTLATLPWTTLFMMDTIQRLIEVAKDESVRDRIGQAGTVALLKKWKWMNMVRAGLSLAGGAVGSFVFAASL